MVVEVVVAPAETGRGPHDLIDATTLESLDCRQPGMLDLEMGHKQAEAVLVLPWAELGLVGKVREMLPASPYPL